MTVAARYATAALRDGETVEIEGVPLIMDGGGRVTDAGDWYVAQRNTGPKLLTARSFGFWGHGPAGETMTKEHLHGDEHPSCINPVEPAYSFDYHECVKVAIAE